MSKHIKDLGAKLLKSLKPDRPVICDHVNSPDGIMPLPAPVVSTEHLCAWCRTLDKYCPWVEPATTPSRSILCANPDCEVYSASNKVDRSNHTASIPRAILWPLFCEMSGMGDLCHQIAFEKIEQSSAKLGYMIKFAHQPHGILFMMGEPGTGKTYAASGICEYYTRRNTSAIFTTQANMTQKWLDSFKPDNYDNYVEKIKSINLLVVDDFGTGELSSSFLKFFLELLNARMQWSSRGTVITTNLPIKEFEKSCGHALSDRIMTGEIFKFEGKSRRKKQF